MKRPGGTICPVICFPCTRTPVLGAITCLRRSRRPPHDGVAQNRPWPAEPGQKQTDAQHCTKKATKRLSTRLRRHACSAHHGQRRTARGRRRCCGRGRGRRSRPAHARARAATEGHQRAADGPRAENRCDQYAPARGVEVRWAPTLGARELLHARAGVRAATPKPWRRSAHGWAPPQPSC